MFESPWTSFPELRRRQFEFSRTQGLLPCPARRLGPSSSSVELGARLKHLPEKWERTALDQVLRIGNTPNRQIVQISLYRWDGRIAKLLGAAGASLE